MGREDRRVAVVQPPQLNGYQRTQMQRQQQELQQRLMEREWSRDAPPWQAEEEEARQAFLSRRQRSPTFVLDPPPHRVLSPPPTPRYVQQTFQPRTDSPSRRYAAPLPSRADEIALFHGVQRRYALPSFDPPAARTRPHHMHRRPALRTPSPPRTPLPPQRPSRQRLYDEEAFFHRSTLDPQRSAFSYALTAASPSDRLVPWAQQPLVHVPLPWRVPPVAVPPRLRLPPAEPAVQQRIDSQSAFVNLVSPPLSPVDFRPELPPHMRADKLDGGRAALAEQVQEKKADGSDVNGRNQSEMEMGQVVDVEHKAEIEGAVVMDGVAMNEQSLEQEQQQTEQRHTSPQPATAPQAAVEAQQQPVGAEVKAECVVERVEEKECAIEQTVRSSADVERALASCDAEQAAGEQRQSTGEKAADEADADTQQTRVQASSPIIEVVEGAVGAEAAAERSDEEAETRVQSEDDSSASSHYAFVGPAKFDGTPWVRQLLLDNSVHLVDFDDERCNIAFVEADYTPAQLSAQPIAAGKEDEVCFYDMQYIRDTAVGAAKELTEYRLSKPSERS